MNIRVTAFEIFTEIVRKGGYSNLVMASKLPAEMYVTDRGFITALVYGTLDRMIELDYIIASYAKGRVQPRVQDVLRLSIYQLLYMDIPEYTACDEAVKLVKAVGKGALSGYVNAVMHTVLKNKGRIPYPDFEKLPAEAISIRCSFPLFLTQELIAQYGAEETQKMLSYRLEPAVGVRVNMDKITPERFFQELTDKKYEVTAGKLCKNVFLVKGNRIFSDILFTNGFCSIQSEPSVLICNIMAPKSGQRVLDCCAAPGGKSVYMAELMQEGQIIATDLHEHRVNLIRVNADRCGCGGRIEALCRDAAVYDPSLGEFDCVLVDAPCSGLGVADAKPDIKNTVTSEGLAELERIQEQILQTSARYVAKNGTLVYSTCTIRRAENISQVERFLKKNPDFELSAPEPIPPSAEKALCGGCLQFLPYRDGVEGFFVAKMIRKR